MVDKEGNMIVAICKYDVLSSLIHSAYGFLVLALFIGAITCVVREEWFWSLILFFLCLLFWLLAWVNANDKLKNRIYPTLLEQHLLKNSKISAPFVIKSFSHNSNAIKCITDNGEEWSFKVEFLQEQLPLYVIKIHVLSEEQHHRKL